MSIPDSVASVQILKKIRRGGLTTAVETIHRLGTSTKQDWASSQQGERALSLWGTQ
jgi:hypothetical protein